MTRLARLSISLAHAACTASASIVEGSSKLASSSAATSARWSMGSVKIHGANLGRDLSWHHFTPGHCASPLEMHREAGKQNPPKQQAGMCREFCFRSDSLPHTRLANRVGKESRLDGCDQTAGATLATIVVNFSGPPRRFGGYSLFVFDSGGRSE